MGGIPQCNFPTFYRVAHFLRERGYIIVSPAELESKSEQAAAMASLDGHVIDGPTWGDCLARDIKIVADKVEGVILLPNWTKSRGARLEAFTGLLCKCQFAVWCEKPAGVDLVSSNYVRASLKQNMP